MKSPSSNVAIHVLFFSLLSQQAKVCASDDPKVWGVFDQNIYTFQIIQAPNEKEWKYHEFRNKPSNNFFQSIVMKYYK